MSISEITKYYEKYEVLRHKLLNYPKIIEYLFNKPLEKYKTVGDLSFDFDCTVKTVLLSEKDNLKISNFFIYMDEQFRQYNELYENSGRYRSHFDKHFFTPVEKLSHRERKVYNFLDKIDKKYEIYFISKWKFKIEGEHTSLNRLPTINFDLNITCDFFCCLMYQKKLHLFVIECDSGSHYDKDAKNFIKIHLNDLLQQHFLFQMNVHLLRLNNTSHIKSEIKNFIKEIIEGSNYVISGQIEPEFSFRKPICTDHLEAFNDDYFYNHNIYLKIAARTKSYNIPDEETEVVLVGKNKHKDDPRNNIHYKEKPADIEYTVSRNAIEQILQEKEDFRVPTKEDREFDDLIGYFRNRIKNKN